MSKPPLKMRKSLDGAEPPPRWPPGISLVPFGPANARAALALLEQAFAQTEDHVPEFDEWWRWLTTDSEYDPELCILAVDERARVVGFAQCWTSGFVKDIAVAEHWRRRGLGTCLLREAFSRFGARGIYSVDLKVRSENTGAQHLYHSLGMVEVWPLGPMDGA